MNKKDLRMLSEAYTEVIDTEFSPQDAYENEIDEHKMVQTSLETARRKIDTILSILEAGHLMDAWMEQKLSPALDMISEIADKLETHHNNEHQSPEGSEDMMEEPPPEEEEELY